MWRRRRDAGAREALRAAGRPATERALEAVVEEPDGKLVRAGVGRRAHRPRAPVEVVRRREELDAGIDGGAPGGEMVVATRLVDEQRRERRGRRDARRRAETDRVGVL